MKVTRSKPIYLESPYPWARPPSPSNLDGALARNFLNYLKAPATFHPGL